MTPTEAITALEKALEAGPTQKDWLHGVRRDGSIWLSIGDREGKNGHHQGDLVALPVDAQWICAANPLAIRALLDAHAGALRDAKALAELQKAAADVCEFIHGALPTTGYLRDNDKSRAALHRLRAALATNTKGTV